MTGGRWQRGHGFYARFDTDEPGHGPRLVSGRRALAIRRFLRVAHRLPITYTAPDGLVVDGTALECRSDDGEKRSISDFRDLDGNPLPFPPPPGGSYDTTSPANVVL